MCKSPQPRRGVSQTETGRISCASGKIPCQNRAGAEYLERMCRLITNCIIYYQAYILSTLLEQKEKEGKQEEADLIKRISPIAWQNVNLLGRFEFQRQQKTINIQEMISLYVQKIEWQQLKTVKVEP